MWLIVLHFLYVVALICAYRYTPNWRPQTRLQAIADDGTHSQELAEAHERSLTSQSKPFVHPRNTFSLILHIICALLALQASLRVLDCARVELSSITKGGDVATSRSSNGALLQQGEHLRHPRDRESLVPKQRGGRMSVQDILEQDVAHLAKKEHVPPPTRRVDEDEGDVDGYDEHQRTASPADEAFLAKHRCSTHSAAPALLFHVLSLLLCITHMVLYGPWSFVDPRRTWKAPRSHYLKPRLLSVFQATSITAYLMLVTLMAAFFCFLYTRGYNEMFLDDGAAASSAGEAVIDAGAGFAEEFTQSIKVLSEHQVNFSPYGLITGLFYLPFFLTHAYRFVLNSLLLWKFRTIFPQIASSPEALRKQLEKARLRKRKQSSKAVDKRRRDDGVNEEENGDASTCASSSSGRRDAMNQDDEDSDCEVEREEMDMELLKELASFAPAEESTASSSASTSLEPSALMQKLRNVPKYQEILEKERKEKQSKKNK